MIRFIDGQPDLDAMTNEEFDEFLKTIEDVAEGFYTPEQSSL